MWRLASFFLVLVFSNSVLAQTDWTWTELDTMPFRTANNAVCEAIVNGEEYVYSFGGIGTDKDYAAIHPRSFKYTVSTGTWTEIDSLPDTTPKIASGASFVKGKIYVFGGYHVGSDDSEVSSDKVHIYNPTTDLYESDGTSIPIPIDDHVQAVYKDSLIFIVTGWSNTGNVPNVQIYDPSFDSWQVGTSTTNNAFYTAFGTSGAIIGDTLYYYGGASGGAFGAKKFMRKGFINPTDPTDITWELMDNAPGDPNYRSACSTRGNTIFWVGGSPTSYNYDGIAYDGSGGVNPSARVMHFSQELYSYSDDVNQPYGVMDLRGIAKLGNDRWIICGGMDTNQVVSNRTFLLENLSLGFDPFALSQLQVSYGVNHITIESNEVNPAYLIDMSGRKVEVFEKNDKFVLRKNELNTGIYLFIQNEKKIRISIQ